MPALEIVAILLLILFNGVLAMSEIAVVTSRRTLLEQMAAAGQRSATAALDLARRPTHFLSTVQVGITLVGVLAGAIGGATLTAELGARVGRIPALAPYADLLAFLVIVSAISYLSLIFGELVPKRLALTRPEAVARRVAPLMQVLARLTGPVAALLAGTTDLLLKLLGQGSVQRPTITEQEIAALLTQAAQAGVVHPIEQDIAERVLRLADEPVRAIMTARPDVEWIDANEEPGVMWDQLASFPHAHVLVCDTHLDDVIGVVRSADLLAARLRSSEVDLRALVREPHFVPATMSILRLLETIRASAIHVAIVLDEFGAVTGIVTLTDILQGLVGEFPTEGSPASLDIVARPDGSWLVDGTVPVGEAFDRLDLGPLPVEERASYHTLAGFVVTRVSRIPRAGDVFDWRGIRFEIVDMDGRRVDKVLITPPGPRQGP